MTGIPSPSFTTITIDELENELPSSDSLNVENFKKTELKTGAKITLVLIGVIAVMFIATIIVVVCQVPPLPTSATDLVSARTATFEWGKEVIQIVLASFVPVLAGLIGYLFGSKSRDEPQDNSASE